MVPMNTCKRTKLAPGENENHIICKPKGMGRNRENKLITRRSPDAMTARQIDYIRDKPHVPKCGEISKCSTWMARKYGTTKTTWSSANGQKIATNGNYKKTSPPETGNITQYDIKRTKQDTQKTARWITQRTAPLEITTTMTAKSEWKQLRTHIQQAPQHRYPMTPQKNHTPRTRMGAKRQNMGQMGGMGGITTKIHAKNASPKKTHTTRP